MDGEQSGLDAGLDEMFAGFPDIGESEADVLVAEAESPTLEADAVAPSDDSDTPALSADAPIHDTEPGVEVDWKARAEANEKAATQFAEFQEKLKLAVEQRQAQEQQQQYAQRMEADRQAFLERIAVRLAEQNGGQPDEFRSQATQIAEQINAHPDVVALQQQHQYASSMSEDQMKSVAAILMSVDAGVEDGILTPEAAEWLQKQALDLRKMPTFDAMQSQVQRDAQMKKVFRDQLQAERAKNEALIAENEKLKRVSSGVDRVAVGGAPVANNANQIDSFLDDFFG